jgi:hypothetical protein
MYNVGIVGHGKNKFDERTNDHIKSGACWTAKQAMQIGKQAVWHII